MVDFTRRDRARLGGFSQTLDGEETFKLQLIMIIMAAHLNYVKVNRPGIPLFHSGWILAHSVPKGSNSIKFPGKLPRDQTLRYSPHLDDDKQLINTKKEF